MEIKEKKTTGLKREFEITITNKTINELVENKISELAPKRVEKVTDVVNEGDIVSVKVIGFDKGKVKLSIKDAAN